MSSERPASDKRDRIAEDKPRVRGLPSIDQARQDRRRTKWLPARFWLWAMTFIGAGIIVWWKIDQGEIEELKGELLARQRAVAKELGPRWFPLRDKIEAWTAACGREAFVEQPAEGLVEEWDFRDEPGIYLRLAQSATKTPAAIREAATKSLRDGFTSCLFTVDNPSPLSGSECIDTSDCPDKQLCNEFNHCQEPSQPVNLRLAYKSLHMLGDEWVAEVQEIDNKLTARGALATFDAANKLDLPVATDLLLGSKYFLVVVDEAVQSDTSELKNTLPEADAGTEDDRSIPTAPHPARICMWRLSDGESMFALRGEAAGELRGTMGPTVGPQTRIAQQRQANSCSLALAVRDAIGAEPGVAVVEEDGTGGTGGAGGAEGAGGGGATSPAAATAEPEAPPKGEAPGDGDSDDNAPPDGAPDSGD